MSTAAIIWIASVAFIFFGAGLIVESFDRVVLWTINEITEAHHRMIEKMNEES